MSQRRDAPLFQKVQELEEDLGRNEGIPECGMPVPDIHTQALCDRVQRVLREFRVFIGDAVLVGHNAAFDLRFLRIKEVRAGVHFRGPVLDTLGLSRYLHDHTPDHSLDAVAKRLGVDVKDRHTALGDSLITAQVFLKLLHLLRQRGITTLGQAAEVSRL